VREVASGAVVSQNVRSFQNLCEQMQQYYESYVPSYVLHGDFQPGTVSTVYFRQTCAGDFSLSVLTAIFPGAPGLASSRMSQFWILLDLRVMAVLVTTGAVRFAKLQSNHYCQHTNTQLFTTWMSFLSPTQQCQSTDGIVVEVIFYLTNIHIPCMAVVS